jgi:nucleoside-diphosphate-sugar epimerase
MRSRGASFRRDHAGRFLKPECAPFRVVNIGRGAPIALLDFVEAIEAALGRKAERILLPMQPGDVPATFASADLLERLTGYRPATGVGEGVGQVCRMVSRLLRSITAVCPANRSAL